MEQYRAQYANTSRPSSAKLSSSTNKIPIKTKENDLQTYLAQRPKSATPGPGRYTVNEQKSSAPQFSIKGKYNEKFEVTPGPGQYNVNKALDYFNKSQKATINAHTVSYLDKILKMQNSTTGPLLEAKSTLNKIGAGLLGGPFKEHKKFTTPAPGDYRVEDQFKATKKQAAQFTVSIKVQEIKNKDIGPGFSHNMQRSYIKGVDVFEKNVKQKMQMQLSGFSKTKGLGSRLIQDLHTDML
ncbi:outer_dense fiber protein [Hexamita inflata]|uniref:Outer dense fiber protein n=1 Tax=Hexamita inflata TaxID=28002 RepID=A0AA86TV55_9EUKA|nr:outer dense fiber protein [Hexamita inflata]